MCGIVGIIGPGSEQVSLSASLHALSQRGPDRQAALQTGQAHLGHTRLSIIDTSAQADQPMQDPTGRYTLVFNGEIYNYRTIADSLRKQGIALRTQSDTEVLLQLLILKGEAALQELNGFFAFAFYDREEDKAIIARDRMGIKPLYIQSDSYLRFASEMKALAPLLPSKQIDHTALSLYFRFNYIPHGVSIYEGVRQLAPGHVLTWNKGVMQEKAYYRFEEQSANNQQSLYELLEDAVKLRLVSDVPLGSFLSGGMDSSIIAALAVKHKSGFKTFSIGFKDNAHFDESAYAEKVAKHIGSDHQTIQLTEDEMLQHVTGLLDYVDEPFADSSAIAVHALSQQTRTQVTVALSGDGADELFGGYNKHQAHLAAIAPGAKERMAAFIGGLSKGVKGGHASALGNRLRQAQRFKLGKDMSPTERYWTWASWTQADEVNELLKITADQRYADILHSLGPKDGSIEEVLRADTRCVLPCDMLTKVDRMSMANSLEVRVPFLDHRVVEYAHGLSAAERFGRGEGKKILRSSFGHLLPEDIFTRKKKGFEVPLEKWFLGPLHENIRLVLEDGALLDSRLFQENYLKRLSDELHQGRISHRVHLLWALMVFHRFLTLE